MACSWGFYYTITDSLKVVKIPQLLWLADTFGINKSLPVEPVDALIHRVKVSSPEEDGADRSSRAALARVTMYD